MAPIRVLFLCTGNSARSQMAEGLLRDVGKGDFEVFSAGAKPSRLHPLAVEAMAEIGIDISQQRSKHLDELRDQPFDYVITVCDNARDACPLFPGTAQRLHWSYPDPAAVEGDEATQRQAFRQVLAEMSARIRQWASVEVGPEREQRAPAEK